MDQDDWFVSSERQVRWEPLFSEQLAGLGIDPKKLDDVMFGVETALSRAPDIFPKVPSTAFSFARLTVYREAPALRLYFTYDAIEVRLVFVEFDEERLNDNGGEVPE